MCCINLEADTQNTCCGLLGTIVSFFLQEVWLSESITSQTEKAYEIIIAPSIEVMLPWSRYIQNNWYRQLNVLYTGPQLGWCVHSVFPRWQPVGVGDLPQTVPSPLPPAHVSRAPCWKQKANFVDMSILGSGVSLHLTSGWIIRSPHVTSECSVRRFHSVTVVCVVKVILYRLREHNSNSQLLQ